MGNWFWKILLGILFIVYDCIPNPGMNDQELFKMLFHVVAIIGQQNYFFILAEE